MREPSVARERGPDRGDAHAPCEGGGLRSAVVAPLAVRGNGWRTTLGPEADTLTGLRPIPPASPEGVCFFGGIEFNPRRGCAPPLSTRRRHERCFNRCPRQGPRPRAGVVSAGTPQHNPLMASESARVRARSHAQGHRKGHAEGRAEGHAEGRAEGRAEGHAEGRVEGRSEGHMDAVAAVLASRGIEPTPEMTALRALCSAIPGAVVVAAALACTGEADFRRRIREQRGLHAELRRRRGPA